MCGERAIGRGVTHRAGGIYGIIFLNEGKWGCGAVSGVGGVIDSPVERGEVEEFNALAEIS